MIMKAGIIGGTGKMGKLFVPVFERAGYEVLTSGRSTTTTPEEIAATCDLVIVSVPIRNTVRVIRKIAPLLKKGQLLCDFTSLKTKPIEAMLESAADVVGLHPMFGPTVSSLKSQTIIVCPARVDDRKLNDLVAIFRNEGARCTIATPEEHDRMMAVVQGLTHYVTLCMAESIRRLKIDIESTGEFTSPVYQIELSLIGRLLSQDPELYADILEENPYVPEVLAACRGSAADLEAIVKRHDAAAFREFFEANSRHLGAYTKKGQETTDMLIDCMVNR
jgi:prephenate dehydrogenase